MIDEAILIVEDSQTMALLAESELQEKLHCQTLRTNSLQATQALLEAEHPPIFVAVVDLTLPDSRSGEIVDYIVSKGIHVIVLTGTFGEEWRETLLAKNVVDYLLKRDTRDFDYLAQLIQRVAKNATIQVLVVDESPSYRAYLHRLLMTQNFQVLEAQNSSEALEQLNKHPQIRMVITDYQVPALNGVELVSQIRECCNAEQLAVIGISNQNDATLSARFLKSGGSDFLLKPFSTEEFNCRVRLNIERIEQIEELKESLETKNRFLGIAAHDLRNPLGSIQGFSQLLLRGGKLGTPTPGQADLLQEIVSASRQMLKLLEDLLDVSVIEAGKLNLKLQPCDLSTLIHEYLFHSRLLAEHKQIQILSDLLPEVEVHCDPQRVIQILDNLLSNAIKFSEPETLVHVRLFPHDTGLTLQIEDQGPGLSAADQALLFRAFQPLSSLPTAGENSTGLGLAIVKRMVEAHGWQIQVRSELGRGSVFEVQIPLPAAA